MVCGCAIAGFHNNCRTNSLALNFWSVLTRFQFLYVSLSICKRNCDHNIPYSPCSCWFFWSSLLQSGSESSGKGFEMQLLMSAWLLFSLVIISSYTANLTVFLSKKTPSLPFSNVNQVKKIFCFFFEIPFFLFFFNFFVFIRNLFKWKEIRQLSQHDVIFWNF